MKRIIAVFSLYLISALCLFFLSFKLVVAETVTGTSAEELNVSTYRHFVIYPHLEKALKAQKNNNQSVALKEFEHIHKLAPESIPLVVYLVEAYRYFGHDEKARALLLKQLKQHPNDIRLQKQLSALPIIIEPITTLAELKQQQQRCDDEPTTECKSIVGQNALRLGALDIALQQLDDSDFKKQPQAKSLAEDIVQRAIHLKQWPVVAQMFSEKYKKGITNLSATEKNQWFMALVLGRLDSQLLALQSQGLFNDASENIAYASSLVERAEQAQLAQYLATAQPKFKTPEQEKSWLYLLSNHYPEPYQVFINYQVVFPENSVFIAGETLPLALKDKDYAVAQRILKTLPKNDYLDARYTLSLATDNKQESLRIAREFYKKNPLSLTYLDQLSWQLIKVGDTNEAIRLLVSRYPFSGNKTLEKTLTLRLSELVSLSPNALTANQKDKLLMPLATAELREFQSTLSWFADDCSAIVALLDDFSPNYEAETWRLLAGCYRDEFPGLALYAYQQAEARQEDVYNHRAVAYQAYQVKDYQEALRAWNAIDVEAMSSDDLRAATQTAQAANDDKTRDRWLLEQKRRGLDNTEHYWWLHAQRYLPNQLQLALDSLNRAITIEPTVRGYISRSAIYRQQNKLDEAIQDLNQSILLEPDNRELQAALGYALWDKGEFVVSRQAHEKALEAMPDDAALLKQLTYVNQRLDDVPQTQKYARHVIDNINYVSQVEPLSPEQNQTLFDFRRLHENVARRWAFNVDMSVGLNAGSIGAANPTTGGAPNKSYRSFGQTEMNYRLGRNQIVEGDEVSLYSRVFADTGEAGKILPVKDPMLGVGVRWKPLRDSIFFVALEQQQPLNKHGNSDTMARVSASYFNGGRFSDEWHPNGKGWLAQNLYLDAAYYLKNNVQAWTADYRISWHQKVVAGQTVEPYAHVQSNGYRSNSSTQGNQLMGIGVRWNIWLGETQYNAWPHKVSLGLEYQHTLNTINQPKGKRGNAFFTLGVNW